ncbi:MAG: hypothetical protein JW797_03855 [Bradymonadales bacterium]|nr:hypothetical protein [Bradymonadales bacterium]
MRISRELAASCQALTFSGAVSYVYHPLVYARQPHERYLTRYARPGIEAMFVGMNPGPFGMAQTGVPFGEVNLVRDWLGIEAPVERPPREHPKRLVLGFACTRSEVSGARLWGWARERFGTPDRFFARFFVGNYCPLLFLEESGRNLTPDKLGARERQRLFALCDEALRKVVEVLAPRIVVGVGTFAESRARSALDGLGTEVGRIPHPSPASPAANRGWAEQAVKSLVELGVLTEGDPEAPFPVG